MNEYACHTDENGSYQINSTFLEPIQEGMKTEKLSELWKMNFNYPSFSHKNSSKVVKRILMIGSVIH